MQVKIVGRHMDVPENLRGYIEEKISKLPRFYDRVMDIEVIIDGEKSDRRIEIVVSVPGHPDFVAEHRSDDLFASFDLCLDRIEKQIRRFKDKVRDRKHHAGGRKESGGE